MPQPPALPPNDTNIHVTADVLPNSISPQFENNGYASTNSTSESENVIHQRSSQSNYNINSNHVNYIQLHNGSRVPVPTWDTHFVYNPQTGDKVVKTGITVPFGGGSKKLVHKAARIDNTARTASVCTALIKNQIQIDYAMIPELSDCQYFKQRTVVQATPSNEVALLKQQMQEYQKLIEQQQRTIMAFQLRLEQMQHQAPVKGSW